MNELMEKRTVRGAKVKAAGGYWQVGGWIRDRVYWIGSYDAMPCMDTRTTARHHVATG